VLQPERIKGEEYSIHSEVWSLGVSLFEVRAQLMCVYANWHIVDFKLHILQLVYVLLSCCYLMVAHYL